MIKIQSELKAPKKNYNNFGGYKYRSLEDILEAVKPLLKKNNCILTISDDIVEVWWRVYIKATTILKNEKGETEKAVAYAREAEDKKKMDTAQITGAASSYARKYALQGLFLLDDGENDPDSLNKWEEEVKNNKEGQENKEVVWEFIKTLKESEPKNENELNEIVKNFYNANKNKINEATKEKLASIKKFYLKKLGIN